MEGPHANFSVHITCFEAEGVVMGVGRSALLSLSDRREVQRGVGAALCPKGSLTKRLGWPLTGPTIFRAAGTHGVILQVSQPLSKYSKQ